MPLLVVGAVVLAGGAWLAVHGATLAPIPIPPYTSPTIGYELRSVPAGTFSMGSPTNEANRGDDEQQHDVTLTRAYLMGTTEVTQQQWETVMGSNPSQREAEWEYDTLPLIHPAYPVQNVSWCDAVGFANALSSLDGLTPAYVLPLGMSVGMDRQACEELATEVVVVTNANGYRLPTEAEWERAARGGTATIWAGTDLDADLCRFANVLDKSYNARFGSTESPSCDDQQEGVAAVGSYAANAYGLYDMSGNVEEWTWDNYNASYSAGSTTDPMGAKHGPDRVYRGGSWDDSADDARAANRSWINPGFRDYGLGLRLSRTIP
jgi:sulfatase modifying factor 1